MRRDLLGSIKEERDVTNAIMLTHNIDFVFVQTVVLSALRRCGHPSLTIFADAACAATSFACQVPVLQGLGVRYRVVPVEMAAGFRFHPKAVLLSGPASATLYVGSGNLTFGGWRENAEVWVRFDTRTDGAPPFAAFLRYLNALLELIVLSEHVRAAIEEAFDPNTHTWAADLSDPGGLLGRAGGGSSLLDQMLARLPEGVAQKITVCAPYFDEDADALAAIVGRARGAPVEVLVQPGRTGLTDVAWRRGGAGAQLAPISFQRLDDRDKVRESFLHAKFYAVEHSGRVRVFAGSANCSRAALTMSGSVGNAELMATLEMSADEFRASFTEELVPRGGPAGLASRVPEEGPRVTGLRILRASYEHGYLRVGYAPRDSKITACLADGVKVRFERVAVGVIGAQLERATIHVRIEGMDGETTMQSALVWVDHESELRSTARGRSVAETIRNRVRAGQWGVGAWAEVLASFCAHLRYLPTPLPDGRGIGTGPDQHKRPSVEYSAKDVFATSFALPSLSNFLPPSKHDAEGRVQSLQQLLLRWFGVPSLESEAGVDGLSSAEHRESAADEDLVDKPEELRTAAVALDAAAPDERNLARVGALVTQMADAMTDDAFLGERSPDLLGTDLKIASALLRVALREGWLDPDTFFQTTHRIWSHLLFSAEADVRGWLQRRYESAASPDEFARAMRSPELLASLVAWVLAVPNELRSPAGARFALASALAVSRLPWLWDGMNDEAVCQELADLLVHSNPSSVDDTTSAIDAVGHRWLRFLQRGHALRRLERNLTGCAPARLAAKIRQNELTSGELLWQGSSGFCVVTRSVQRVAGRDVNVLPLRGDRERGKQRQKSQANQKRPEQRNEMQAHGAPGEITFMAEFTVPLAALLDASVLPHTEDFGQAPREVLRAFVTELAKGLRIAEG